MLTANLPASVLSHDAIRRTAPSVFAERPWHAMSDRYMFVPTIAIVDRLASEGFYPTSASQSYTRLPDKREHATHLLRFSHLDYLTGPLSVGSERPEIVLRNSHDGSSVYELMGGIFRPVCSNGAIVRTADSGTVKVRHVGNDDVASMVLDASYEVLSITNLSMGQVDEWKQIQLDRPQQLALAEAAQELRPSPLEPAALLTTRRAADNTSDLWTTFNVIQENTMKGELSGRHPETHRRFRTRPVKSVNANVNLNRGLWVLAERMAELVK